MTGLAHASDYLRADTVTRGDRSGLWLMTARIAASLFYIAVTLFVFANIQDRSQTITVALIGLVFASLRATTLAGTCAQRRVALLLENEIKSVRRSVADGLPPVSDAELDRSLDALAKPLHFEYAGLAIVAGVCFYYMGIAIVYGMAYQQLLGLH